MCLIASTCCRRQGILCNVQVYCEECEALSGKIHHLPHDSLTCDGRHFVATLVVRNSQCLRTSPISGYPPHSCEPRDNSCDSLAIQLLNTVHIARFSLCCKDSAPSCVQSTCVVRGSGLCVLGVLVLLHVWRGSGPACLVPPCREHLTT